MWSWSNTNKLRLTSRLHRRHIFGWFPCLFCWSRGGSLDSPREDNFRGKSTSQLFHFYHVAASISQKRSRRTSRTVTGIRVCLWQLQESNNWTRYLFQQADSCFFQTDNSQKIYNRVYIPASKTNIFFIKSKGFTAYLSAIIVNLRGV